MKRALVPLFALLCAAALAACAQPSAPPPSESISSAPAVSQAAGEPDLPLSNQEQADLAYEQLLDAFGTPMLGAPGYPNCPEEFGDAYYEDGLLYICLTDTSDAVQSRYRALVDTPDILRFRQVTYGYNDLNTLLNSTAEALGGDFISVGINVQENQVEVGIKSLAREAKLREKLEQALPQDIISRFSELPIYFYEESGTLTY